MKQNNIMRRKRYPEKYIHVPQHESDKHTHCLSDKILHAYTVLEHGMSLDDGQVPDHHISNIVCKLVNCKQNFLYKINK